MRRLFLAILLGITSSAVAQAPNLSGANVTAAGGSTQTLANWFQNTPSGIGTAAAATAGTAVGNVLGPLTSASGFPKLSTGNRLILQRAASSATDVNDFQFDRVTSFTGGTASNINSNMRVTTSVGANDGSQEWNILGIVNSAGTTGVGLPVAAYFQGNRLAGSIDHMWALIADVKDKSNQSSSASATPGLEGFELDVSANDADDAINSASFGGTGNRTGINIAIFRDNTGNATQTQISHGIWFTAADANLNFGSALSFGVNTETYSALDTRGAIVPTGSTNPLNAVIMTSGHVIEFNGGAALNSAPSRTLRYASTALTYMTGAVGLFTVTDPVGSNPTGAMALGYTSSSNLWALRPSTTSNFNLGGTGGGFVTLGSSASGFMVLTNSAALGAPTGAVPATQGWLNLVGIQSNGTAGVTCTTGATTALFSSLNGIVTHC